MKNALLLICFMMGITALAQPGGKDKREWIKTRKIAFISDEIDLSSAEAEKFWPIYNEYEEKDEAFHKKRREHMKEMREIDELSDDKAYDLLEELFSLEESEIALRKEYHAKFAEVLGKKKATKVYIAEEKFKREIIRYMKDGHDRPPGGPHDRHGGPYQGE